MATTVSVSETTAQANETAPGEQSLVLYGIGWDQYETVLKAFPEQGGLRITYVDRRLTLVSPISRRHDWHEHVLGRLVETVASSLGIEWEPAVHATFHREDLEVGVEGDQTFYFGPHAELMRGPVNVDLSTQPPPDLAIEVEVSHRSDDSVEVWRRLGVPEVWRLHVDRKSLVFLIRQPDGSYKPAERSRVLAVLEPADVLAQLQVAQQLGSSRWTRQLADWVRDTLLPRRGG
jgi:Uma2 family endonuclease